jgi:hypothetical protein
VVLVPYLFNNFHFFVPIPVTNPNKMANFTYMELKPKKPSLPQFSYSTALDYVLIVLGTTASVLHGAGFPLLSIVLGGMTSGMSFA